MAALRCLVLHQYPCAADSIFLSRISITTCGKRGRRPPGGVPDGKIWGVLDIDSPMVGRFTEHDLEGLSKYVAVLEKQLEA